MFNSEKVFAILLKRYQSSVICFVKTRNSGVRQYTLDPKFS